MSAAAGPEHFLTHAFRRRQDEYGSVFPDTCAVCGGPEHVHATVATAGEDLDGLHADLTEVLVEIDQKFYRVRELIDAAEREWSVWSEGTAGDDARALVEQGRRTVRLLEYVVGFVAHDHAAEG